jgi:hypothetical protein
MEHVTRKPLISRLFEKFWRDMQRHQETNIRLLRIRRLQVQVLPDAPKSMGFVL